MNQPYLINKGHTETIIYDNCKTSFTYLFRSTVTNPCLSTRTLNRSSDLAAGPEHALPVLSK